MSAGLIDGPWVVFALHREAQSFRRLLGRGQSWPNPVCSANLYTLGARRLLVLEVGIGSRRMEKTLDALLVGANPYRPPSILLAGFSGSLHDPLQIGDLVLGTEVADAHGHHWPLWNDAAHDGATSRWRSGKLLTSAHLVGDPEAKRELGERYQAIAVDMESAAAARVCERHGVKLTCVRAISDRVADALSPQLVACLAGEHVSWRRLALTMARRPLLAREMWRLGRHTSYAARELARGLVEVIGPSGSK